ncbi:MAG: S1 RNA-binding domain-containing protein [Pseudobdellovibrionaceae bacterium]
MEMIDQNPYKVGDFALLEVAAIENVGAFLDWGQPKDLFLPFSEQTRPLHVGDAVIVYIYMDNTERIASTMKLNRHLDKTPVNYEAEQTVNLMIADKTELGIKAIINGQHWGLIHRNEIFSDLSYGQKVQGLVKQVRVDGKIDLTFQKSGHKAAAEDISPRILSLLKEKGGFLAVNDKTPPENIYNLFGVSKKKYKIALGGLYKKRLIKVDADGIRLV